MQAPGSAGADGSGTPAGTGVWATPFNLVSRDQQPRRAVKSEIMLAARELEQQARLVPPDVAAACLQDVRYLTARTRRSYQLIAAGGTPTTLYAQGLPAYVGPGVLGVALDEADPLIDVWAVLLAGPQPVALAATDLHEPDTDDASRPFLLAVSHDPDVVAACLDTFTLRRVTVPGDLALVASRLAAELAGPVPPEVISAAVRDAACDLNGTAPSAWPELVERSARQRLLDILKRVRDAR